MKNLKGSEKQVAWAEEIRKECFKEIGSTKIDPSQDQEKSKKIFDLFKRCEEWLENIEDAQWWIDNRGAKTGKEWGFLAYKEGGVR